jgi:hypothetical protein
VNTVKNIRLLLATAGTILFNWLFYIRYWKWRDCIAAAQSSCVTPDGDNLVGAGAAWIVPGVLCGLLALREIYRSRA